MQSQEQPPFSHALSIRVTSPSDIGLGATWGARPQTQLGTRHRKSANCCPKPTGCAGGADDGVLVAGLGSGLWVWALGKGGLPSDRCELRARRPRLN